MYPKKELAQIVWTGKIIALSFQGVQLASRENLDIEQAHSSGKGFYNEFGIDTALGFEATCLSCWSLS